MMAVSKARSTEELREALAYWLEREREEKAEIVGCEHKDNTTIGLLARCAHNYTRGIAAGLSWALGHPDQMIERDLDLDGEAWLDKTLDGTPGQRDAFSGALGDVLDKRYPGMTAALDAHDYARVRELLEEDD